MANEGAELDDKLPARYHLVPAFNYSNWLGEIFLNVEKNRVHYIYKNCFVAAVLTRRTRSGSTLKQALLTGAGTLPVRTITGGQHWMKSQTVRAMHTRDLVKLQHPYGIVVALTEF